MTRDTWRQLRGYYLRPTSHRAAGPWSCHEAALGIVLRPQCIKVCMTGSIIRIGCQDYVGSCDTQLQILLYCVCGVFINYVSQRRHHIVLLYSSAQETQRHGSGRRHRRQKRTTLPPERHLGERAGDVKKTYSLESFELALSPRVSATWLRKPPRLGSTNQSLVLPLFWPPCAYLRSSGIQAVDRDQRHCICAVLPLSATASGLSW